MAEKKLLRKALTNDREDIPGYLIKEIVQATYQSEQAPTEMVALLWQGLNKSYGANDAFVKLKYLRIIRHCCERGHPQFLLLMQRSSQIIKQLSKYNPAPDLFCGDAPAKEVQLEADRCMQLIYKDNLTHQNTSKSDKPCFFTYPADAPHSQGLATSPGSRQTATGGSSEKRKELSSLMCRIEGFGNTPMIPLGVQGGFGGPNNHDTFSNLSGIPSLNALSNMFTTNSSTLVSGISQAVNSVSTMLPDSVKMHINQLSRFTSLQTDLQNSNLFSPSAHSLANSNWSASNSAQSIDYSDQQGTYWARSRRQGLGELSTKHLEVSRQKYAPHALSKSSQFESRRFQVPAVSFDNLDERFGYTTENMIEENTTESTDIDFVSFCKIVDRIDTLCPQHSLRALSPLSSLMTTAFSYCFQLFLQFPEPFVHICCFKLGLRPLIDNLLITQEHMTKKPVVPAATWIEKVNIIQLLLDFLQETKVNPDDKNRICGAINSVMDLTQLVPLRKLNPKIKEVINKFTHSLDRQLPSSTAQAKAVEPISDLLDECHNIRSVSIDTSLIDLVPSSSSISSLQTQSKDQSLQTINLLDHTQDDLLLLEHTEIDEAPSKINTSAPLVSNDLLDCFPQTCSRVDNNTNKEPTNLTTNLFLDTSVVLKNTSRNEQQKTSNGFSFVHNDLKSEGVTNKSKSLFSELDVFSPEKDTLESNLTNNSLLLPL